MSIRALPILALAAGFVSRAEAAAIARQKEVSVSGALQVLNENDTAFPESFVNIPLAAEVTYHLTPIWAVAGELSRIIPVNQEVKAGTSSFEDRKSPDILAYQANVVAKLPLANAWTPYMTGGLGAMTFLSNEDADRLPQLPEDETAFALNFGGGASLGLRAHWALRADFREFVAFPSAAATGLSARSDADPVWMERATVGVTYRR